MIGTMLVSDRALYAVHTEAGLRPTHFEAARLGVLFEAMVQLDDETGGFDRVSVVARAEALGLADARPIVEELTIAPARVHDVRRAATIIRDSSTARALRIVASDLASGASEPHSALDRALRSIDAIQADSGAKQARHIGAVAEQVIEEAMAVEDHKTLTGVPTGFRKLDDLTGGWQPSRLIIVAGRPGMGKSALSNAFAMAAAQAGKHVGIWNMEMGDTEVGQRFISSLTGMPSRRFLRGGLTEATVRKLAHAGAELSKVPMWIDDTPDLSIGDLRARVRRLHQRHGLDLVIVDYLQLMRMTPGMATHEALGEISRGLKILGKDIKLPVIALAQLNREVEKRGATAQAKRPTPADLKGSGNLEQDADMIVMPFREDFYDKESPRAGITEILVPKHRGGAKAEEGDIDAYWDGPTMRFTDIQEGR